LNSSEQQNVFRAPAQSKATSPYVGQKHNHNNQQNNNLIRELENSLKSLVAQNAALRRTKLNSKLKQKNNTEAKQESQSKT
jgi:hypothetical protein